MSETATELRALKLFEVFGRVKRPLRLSDLSRELEVPVSSCFALVRRLVAEGYLYEPADRKGFYPTGKMAQNTRAISAADPVLNLAERFLERLRDESDETVTFGRRSGQGAVYLLAFESNQTIRLAGRAGLTRPLHTVAMGKALLAAMPADERAELLKTYSFEARTPRTLQSAAELELELSKQREDGVFVSREESMAGAMALAMPVTLNGETYAAQVAGPVERVEARFRAIADILRAVTADLEAAGP